MSVVDSIKRYRELLTQFKEFVPHLHEIAEHCDFSDKKDAYMRDRTVLGMADRELSERLHYVQMSH